MKIAQHRLRAVIFDLDGTLIENSDRLFSSCQVAMRRLGLVAPHYDHYVEVFRSYRLGHLVEHDRRADFFSLLLEEYESYEGDVACIEGATHALNFCRDAGLATAIVTSRQSAPEQVAAELSRIGIATLIDLIRTQRGVHPIDSLAKEERLEESMDLLGVSRSECVYVGDLPDDVISGKRAGLALTVAVKSGGIRHDLLAAAEPDALLDHVGELPAFLSARMTS